MHMETDPSGNQIRTCKRPPRQWPEFGALMDCMDEHRNGCYSKAEREHNTPTMAWLNTRYHSKAGGALFKDNGY